MKMSLVGAAGSGGVAAIAPDSWMAGKKKSTIAALIRAVNIFLRMSLPPDPFNVVSSIL